MYIHVAGSNEKAKGTLSLNLLLHKSEFTWSFSIVVRNIMFFITISKSPLYSVPFFNSLTIFHMWVFVSFTIRKKPSLNKWTLWCLELHAVRFWLIYQKLYCSLWLDAIQPVLSCKFCFFFYSWFSFKENICQSLVTNITISIMKIGWKISKLAKMFNIVSHSFKRKFLVLKLVIFSSILSIKTRGLYNLSIWQCFQNVIHESWCKGMHPIAD